MRKNVFVFVLAIIAAIGVECSVFFGYHCAKLHAKTERLTKVQKKLRERIDELESRNENLSEIVDSFDNPHHHDYLLSLQCYQALQK